MAGVKPRAARQVAGAFGAAAVGFVLALLLCWYLIDFQAWNSQGDHWLVFWLALIVLAPLFVAVSIAVYGLVLARRPRGEPDA
jgi:hypothetical protein